MTKKPLAGFPWGNSGGKRLVRHSPLCSEIGHYGIPDLLYSYVFQIRKQWHLHPGMQQTRGKQIACPAKHPVSQNTLGNSQGLYDLINSPKKQILVPGSVNPRGIDGSGQVPGMDTLFCPYIEEMDSLSHPYIPSHRLQLTGCTRSGGGDSIFTEFTAESLCDH